MYEENERTQETDEMVCPFFLHNEKKRNSLFTNTQTHTHTYIGKRIYKESVEGHNLDLLAQDPKQDSYLGHSQVRFFEMKKKTAGDDCFEVMTL